MICTWRISLVVALTSRVLVTCFRVADITVVPIAWFSLPYSLLFRLLRVLHIHPLVRIAVGSLGKLAGCTFGRRYDECFVASMGKRQGRGESRPPKRFRALFAFKVEFSALASKQLVCRFFDSRSSFKFAVRGAHRVFRNDTPVNFSAG